MYTITVILLFGIVPYLIGIAYYLTEVNTQLEKKVRGLEKLLAQSRKTVPD